MDSAVAESGWGGTVGVGGEVGMGMGMGGEVGVEVGVGVGVGMGVGVGAGLVAGGRVEQTGACDGARLRVAQTGACEVLAFEWPVWWVRSIERRRLGHSKRRAARNWRRDRECRAPTDTRRAGLC